MKSIDIFNPERRWVLYFSLFVMALTSVPYLVGFAMQGDDWRFTGFVFGVEDGNSYIAKMLSGSYGAWLFRSSYTAVPQKGILANLTYLLSGKLISPPGTHIHYVFIYQLLRFFSGVFAIFATYDFLSFFLGDVKLRRFGLFVVILGGGLGWLIIIFGRNQLLGSLPLEFYSPESFGFLGLMGFPHLSLARATFLWGLLYYLNFFHADAGMSESIKLGGLWLLTSLAQPITSIVMGSVMGLHLFVLLVLHIWGKFKYGVTKWQEWLNIVKHTLIASLIPAPFILYNIYLFTTDEFLRAWTSQNIISSPHAIHYLIAYGLCLPFMIIGSVRLLHDRPWTGLLPVVWVLALPIFVYFPVNVQRRLLEGIWLVIVVLTMYAFVPSEVEKFNSHQSIFNRTFSPRLKYLLILTIPSTLLILVGSVISATNLDSPVYRPVDEISSINYLRGIAKSGEIVLSSYETGNALPAWAPMRVVIGHGPESIGLENLLGTVNTFYNYSTPDVGRIEFIKDLDIQYIFWGPEERKLGDWNPNKAPYLNKIYDEGGYSIFEFVPNSFSLKLRAETLISSLW